MPSASATALSSLRAPRAAAPLPAAGRAGSNAPRLTFEFKASLDLAELDSRRRPGQRWMGRGMELSRSLLIFKSRRLCYEGREIVVGVHLVDDRPVPLFGTVTKSDYEGEGLYKTTLRLMAFPDEEPVKSWLLQLPARLVI